MIVKVFEEIIEYDNETVTPREILDRIIIELEAKELALDHLLIDGEEVPNEHLNYLTKHLPDIQEIQVVPVPLLTLARSNAEKIRDALHFYIAEMDIMAEDFRQGVSQRGWDEFEHMIETLIFIDGAMKRIFNMFLDLGDARYISVWDHVRTEYMKLYPVVTNIENALRDDHPEEAGDWIQQKVKPITEKTVKRIARLWEEEA